MKKTLLIFVLLLSFLGYAQKPKVDYIQFGNKTTIEKLAIDVSDASRSYLVFDTDLDELQINYGTGWVDIGGGLQNPLTENLDVNDFLITNGSGSVGNGIHVRGNLYNDIAVSSINGLTSNTYLRVSNGDPSVPVTNYASFIGSNLIGRSDYLLPNTGATGRYMLFSINGNYADINGNIAIPSGDVTKVGTPVNNQIGVWTGDGTIEGGSDLLFDGSNVKIDNGSSIYSRFNTNFFEVFDNNTGKYTQYSKDGIKYSNSGQSAFTDFLFDAPTSNEAVYVKNESGTVALISDIDDAIATISPTLLTSSTITTSRNSLVTDADGLNNSTSATDVTITIVDNATMPLDVGSLLSYKRSGTGNVILVGGAGVTMPSYQTYSLDDVITIRKTATDTWEFINPPIDVVTSNAAIALNTAKVTYVAPTTETGVALVLDNAVGKYYNMASANAGTTYTFSGATVGGWAKSLINTTTEPTVTGATKIAGATWVTGTDMYLVVVHNGTATQYFFLEI